MIRKFKMYPRSFWQRIKCFFLGHATNYRLMDVGAFTRFGNFSVYRYTCGSCVRCGLGWEDLDRFPYGQPRKDEP